jgi:putative NADH-flavin reductase
MHFLLLGATGRTGKHVVSELLSQGHTAVALIRPIATLSPRPGLTIVTGSPLSKSDIQSTITAVPFVQPDAAIYTLNTVRKSESPFAPQLSPPRFLADSCAAACAVLEQAGIHRIVVMSTAGAGDSWENLPLLSKAFMGWTNVRLALQDHNDLDKEIRETNMDWTLVRASRLQFHADKEEECSEGKNKIDELDASGRGMKMTDSVGVDSAARFLIKCAVSGAYSREAVVIRN